MNVAFRLDVSTFIGTGHLMRCLSLALSLQEMGVRCYFVMRQLGLDMTGRVRAAGFEVHELPAPAGMRNFNSHSDWACVDEIQDATETGSLLSSIQLSWVLVDHYSFGAKWHSKMRAMTSAQIAAIDDLGDRQMAIDVLIDHNYNSDHLTKYQGRCPPTSALLTGPTYALLSPDYANAPRYAYHTKVRSIGIFMGGADIHNHSSMVLDACEIVGFSGPIEVVSTSANPNLSSLRERIASQPKWRLNEDLPSLATFFARHDLQIGAGGGSTWERCCIGVPTLALILAENQRMVLNPLEQLAILQIVRQVPPTRESVAQEAAQIIKNFELRRTLADNSRHLVDGRGAHRVAEFLVKKCSISKSSVLTHAIQ
jgi:UDP-2,4-diacetamido-2,4,6-trideoxy-beta-L-altropyranose hydrolase